ncbi:hypothetical protein KY290_037752 [Solanum tuberosum]|uniref:Uncharacterized protein n=1 Tax=Solanum tuberosum TaxID=4113 RepID=A0ABQ7TWG1_SOLTU|nr:hypothetical protein KY290_037752 [Solanum tuberosum]
MEQDIPRSLISFQMEVRLQNQMTGYGVVMSLACRWENKRTLCEDKPLATYVCDKEGRLELGDL